MSPHTPGPLSKITCPSCHLIVSFTSEFGTSTACELHAAAPELLTALQAVLAEPNDAAWEAARAAVRKATAP